MKNRNPDKSSILLDNTFTPLAGPTVAVTSAVLLLISLALFLLVVPALIRTLIAKETRLLNGTETWEKWTDVKVPILIKFHIFNVTNVEDAGKGGRFRLQEIGPYVWEEKRTKEIIAVDEDEDTVSYREVVRYYFRQDLSVGSQEDTLNIMNVPLLAATTLIYRTVYTSLANYLINIFLEMDETFVLRNVSVRELMFQGVELSVAYSTLADIGVVDMPDEMYDGRFAFYNRRNGTSSNEFKVYRGVKKTEDFGKIVEYDHKKEINWWTNHSAPANVENYCNQINGTDGSIIPPFVTKDKKIRFFAYEICRSVYLEFDREVTFKGIPAYRFTLPDKLLEDPHSNAENGCFCVDPGAGLANDCEGNGAIRIFSCKKGIPIGLSLPHFLNAAKRYHDGVDGLNPDQLKHESEVILEPNSGAILEIVKRIQIVTEFQRLPGIDAFHNITEAVVPVFWVEERADPDETDLSEIRNRLVAPLEVLKVLQPTVLGVLTFTTISGIAMIFLRKTSQQLLLKCNVDL